MATEVAALVGILYAGEPSLFRVLTCLETQESVALRTVLIGHHPFAEAHERLYNIFDARRAEHDVFVKVDADMEIVEPRLLAALGETFQTNPTLDEIILGVDDWMSGERIMGMVAWRRGTRWKDAPSPLFADLPATAVRSTLKIMDAPRPLVLHATFPSVAQSLRYGAQRGLKAVETSKMSRIRRLQDFVRFAQANPARERLLATAAVEVSLEDEGLAGRCLFGLSQLSQSDLDRLSERADSEDLCATTLMKLNDLSEHSSLMSAAPIEPRDSGDIRHSRRMSLAVKRRLLRRSSSNVDMPRIRSELLRLLED